MRSKYLASRVDARPLLLALAATALCSGLAACGGGGGDGGGGVGSDGSGPGSTGSVPVAAGAPEPAAPAPANPTEEAVPTPAAPPGPSPKAPDSSSDPYAPVAGSEPAPRLSAPQPGSTAAAGNDSEGIYESLFGYTFIDPAGKFARRDLLDWTWGSINVTGLNWTFNPDTQTLGGLFGVQTVTGAGTFVAKKSMDGQSSRGGGVSQQWGPLKYSAANALAVDQGSLAGQWSLKDSSNNSVAIEVDPAGAFVGATSGATFGECKVSGKITHTAPQTAKNAYAIEFNASNPVDGSATCALDVTTAYGGPAAIVLYPAGTYVGNGYFRALAFHAKSQIKITSMYLQRQR